jgi:hypothetical protein
METCLERGKQYSGVFIPLLHQILLGHVARLAELRNAYEILAGKPGRKRPLRRPRRRWKNNIRMDLREIGWEGVDLIHLTQVMDQWRALVNTVMNLQVP